MDARRALFGCGLAGILLFDGVWIVDELLQQGYSPITTYVSDLAFYPNGWVLDLAFVVSGALLLAFSVALLRYAQDPVLAVLAGAVALGFVGSGLVPETPAHDPRYAHTLIASAAFGAMVATLLVAAVRWGPRDEWRAVAAYSRAAGPVAVVLLGLLLLAAPEGLVGITPLRPWLGLIQRAFLVPWHLWVILVALRGFALPPRPASAAPTTS